MLSHQPWLERLFAVLVNTLVQLSPTITTLYGKLSVAYMIWHATLLLPSFLRPSFPPSSPFLPSLPVSQIVDVYKKAQLMCLLQPFMVWLSGLWQHGGSFNHWLLMGEGPQRPNDEWQPASVTGTARQPGPTRSASSGFFFFFFWGGLISCKQVDASQEAKQKINNLEPFHLAKPSLLWWAIWVFNKTYWET